MAYVEGPITRLWGSSEINVPETVAPGFPGNIVLSKMTIFPFGSNWTCWPPTFCRVGAGVGAGDDIAYVDDPTINFLDPRETEVPDTIMPDFPGNSVIPTTLTSPFRATSTCWPPIEGRVGIGAGEGIVIIDDPIIKPFESSETGVPTIVAVDTIMIEDTVADGSSFNETIPGEVSCRPSDSP